MAVAPHVMLAEARYYEAISDELARGAIAVLEEAGATYERFTIPGAFEIPAAIQYAVRSLDFSPGRRRFDGYVALGCVIRGETTHYDHICQETSRALQELAVHYSLALGFGVLTVENEEQAWERAKVDRQNKGGDAARACIAMVDLKRRFRLFPR